MNQRFTYLLMLVYSVSFARGGVNDSIEWKELARDKYTVHYTLADQIIAKRIDNTKW